MTTETIESPADRYAKALSHFLALADNQAYYLAEGLPEIEEMARERFLEAWRSFTAARQAFVDTLLVPA